MDLYLGNYWYLLLLLVLPAIGFAIFNFIKWRSAKREMFAETRFHESLFEKQGRFTKILPLMYLLAFLFLILAMMDILGGKEEIKTQQKMNNVLFLLDVSNSMNAEDIQPNRLTEAKNIMINSLKNFTNDRVGVIVFAGDATSIMPLTTDFSAAETYIGGIETSVVKVQGTDFLKAMQVAEDKFKNIPKGSRQVVLISDGEDNEGNDDSAAKLAASAGIAVTTVGVGTEQGAPVPEYLYGQLMGYKSDMMGETVVTKRQTAALQNIAEKTGGSYVDGNNLQEAVQQITESLRKKSGSSQMTVKSQNSIHYYQYPLAVSVLIFFIIFLINPKRDFNI